MIDSCSGSVDQRPRSTWAEEAEGGMEAAPGKEAVARVGGRQAS